MGAHDEYEGRLLEIRGVSEGREGRGGEEDEDEVKVEGDEEEEGGEMMCEGQTPLSHCDVILLSAFEGTDTAS